MGENQDKLRGQTKIKFEPQYLLFILSSVVLLLFIIAFTRPVYPASLYSTTELTLTASFETDQPENENLLTTTPTPELEPPTPEEIGYTDGIIFLATVLIIILLVGTLRETLRRKGE
ncbi:MAG TPA: hypothetical protein DCL08_04480 [Anaerolineaceae bacterium]|nr:MAG: hypothetical protein XE06_0689 [Anaerolineaceae bacterium 46_22]HAF48484.1 hypothetical protein [Anaerolineaceae bacterium]